ncbi:hypothetical protein E5676_scaffold3734G00400 [Cucumis melo var. makuwa]|uniref:Uncharacterized protein n=1 Tax=Cucumis melo var. makuwa TaxID=1194695 RepID=A0A5A7UHA0_CUCMM|nr:hypothetical protein E6C27_scaffold24G004620 [Cucumis melo var. makuwa]TYK08612.1 hypothetical protein E5676_scaffold3734G00400 [Cucumis melo var. makuwa]
MMMLSLLILMLNINFHSLPILVSREDNPDAYTLDISNPSTYMEPMSEAIADRMNSRLDNTEFKLDHMDSRLDYMESSFTTELSAIKELLMVLVKNLHATSRDTNDGNNRKKEGDKDGHVHEDHNIDVDEIHQVGKD